MEAHLFIDRALILGASRPNAEAVSETVECGHGGGSWVRAMVRTRHM
ncbi:MAG TPA: hypothetical protein VGM50_12650 [Gemmatimonadaceae bacterium]